MGWIRRLLAEESGQDIIEYALLTAFIALVGIVTWQSIGTTIGVKYLGWDTGVQGLSCPPNPGGGAGTC